MTLDPATFASGSATLCHEFVLRTYLPREDVPGTREAVTEIVPLRYGSYEQVAFQSQVGTRRFRPVAGSHIGETEQVLEFSVVELIFSIPRDEALLKRVIDRLFEVHTAEEPVIYIDEVCSTRARSHADQSNPHRFWNRPDYDDQSKW